MKKIFLYLLVLTMLLSAILMTACRQNESEKASSAESESTSIGESESLSAGESASEGESTTGESESESLSAGESASEGESESTASEFDYESFDFKPYITLDTSEYVGKHVEIPYDEIMPESYYEARLNQLLAEHAIDIKITDVPAKLGDTVNIYYKGVTIAEDGTETAFDGGTYQDFGKPGPLTLGSGSFIDGFEEGLVGVLPTDTLRVSDTGVITDGDIALVSCTFTSKVLSTGKETTSTDENIYFDFRGDTLLTDLKNALLGKDVGETYSVTVQKDSDKDGTPDVENTYVVTVHGLLDLSTPATVMATFPSSYPNSPELAGKTVKFYVWVESIDGVQLPTLNEAFLLETLKYETEEEDVLAAFEREFRGEAKKAYASECRSAAIGAVADYVRGVVVFNSLPEDAVLYEYACLKEEAEYYYSYYTKGGYKFDSIEDFIIAFYEIEDAGDDFEAETWYRKSAEETLRENALYFYFCDVLGVTVDEQEVTERVNALLDERIENAKENDGKTYTREEMYEKYVSYYGDGYIEMYYRDLIRESKLNDALYNSIVVVYAGASEK